jgi:D-3-phosphoglycerate dehydrogenase
VLDALFDDVDLEQSVAASHGWHLSRWDGDVASLVDTCVVVHVRTTVDRAFLERLPQLRVVGRFGTGLDTVDETAATELGVRVVGVRDYCVPELTSHTLGLAFALGRRIAAAARGDIGPDLEWREVAEGHAIPGHATATVVGFGTIGRAVTRALIGCGMEVRVVTRHGGDDARSLGATTVALDDGLANAGYVFLHSSLTAETAGIIDARRLARMTSTTILVDTARLGLLDQAAVADALRSGGLGGVALDARLPMDSPLRSLLGDPGLVVTPHIGWYSERSARELRRRTIEDSIAAAEAA